MFLSDWRILLRRWYVVVVGLALTAGLCLAASAVSPPHYEVKTSVVLLPGPTTVGKGGNPYLSLGNLEGVAAILARAMSDGAVTQKLLGQGASKDYLVATDPTTAGPVLLITSDAGTAADALRTRELILRELPVRLNVLQESAQVPTRSLISLSTLSQDQEPALIRKSQIRAVFIAFALGMCLTLGSAALLDGWLRRKERGAASEVVVPEAIYTPGSSELAGYGPPAPSYEHGPQPVRHPDIAPDPRQFPQGARADAHLAQAGPAMDAQARQDLAQRIPRLMPTSNDGLTNVPQAAPPTTPIRYPRISQAPEAPDDADAEQPTPPSLMLRGIRKRDAG
jgi:hypothetical protein